MLKPPIPANEIERLQALHALDVLDTPAEERFDRLTRLAQYIMQVPIALVSLVDAERQWFKSRQGLEASETPRAISFCGHAILRPDVMVVPDASADPRFADNPLVLEAPHIRFYAGAPLTLSNGLRVGTLCAIDRQPHQASAAQLAALRDLAQCVSEELQRAQHRRHAEQTEVALQESARLLDSVIENLPVMLFLKRASDLRMVLFNKAGEDMLGFSRDEMLGKNNHDNFPKEQADFFTLKDRQVLDVTGFEDIAEEVISARDGRQLTLHTTKLALRDENGQPTYLLGISEDISERKQAEAALHRSNAVLDAVNHAQSHFIGQADPAVIFKDLLQSILDITGSEYGFIGEMLHSDAGRPYIKTHGITNIAWDEATRRFYEENAPKGLEFHKLDNLFGHAVTRGEVVICNDPASDSRRGGLPKGHPALNSFLGIPFFQDEAVVGMVGIANRAGGYDAGLLPLLQPLLMASKNIIQSLALEQRRLQAEADLIKSTTLVHSIVETVVDGIVTIDSLGTVRSFNSAAQRLFGYSKEEIIGSNVKRLMPEPYATEHDGYLAHYRSTREARVIGIGREVVGRRQDGSTFPMELAVSEMQQADQTLFVGIVRDISERKQIERLKSEFVSTVSHELRTPLTSIRGALGLVIGKFASGLPDKARQLLETASRNSERLTLLINDILDLEKIESGRLDFEFKPLDLTLLAQQAIAANEGYGQQHGVTLQLSAALPGAMVWADEHRLLQVFSNLLSNAVKYSPTGGTVQVALQRHDGRLRVSVRDHGRGIPTEFRSRMFQRFAQADSSDTREKGGTGLGLSITKAIVERHRGSIDFVSESGLGTEFFFELPPWQETVPQTLAVVERPHMLICENNPDVALVLAQLLEHEGVSSDRAATGAAALAMLKQKRYRGLLLDIGLPDMDGQTLIQSLRGDEATRDLPVIVVSGRRREDTDSWDGAALSVLDWLQKPVDRSRLGQALLQALRRDSRPRILHVEDDVDIIQITQALLEEDADYSYATTLAAARQELAQNRFDLLLLDLTLPDGSGLELLDAINPETKVIVFSGQNLDTALTLQVDAALTKASTSNERLLAAIQQALNQDRN